MVRTGTPPCSRMTSGTAREQIRLCSTVPPGELRSTAAARIDVVVDPDNPMPSSSTTNTRSASPSKASPTSKPPASTRARRSRWLAGCSGSAGWFGNVPSSSPYMTSSSICGRRSKTAGTTSPPMPLAVSATIRSGRSAAMSTNDSTWSTNSGSRSASRSDPARGGVGGAVPVEHGRGDGLDLAEAVGVDRLGALQAHLHAVVLGGVVRGREHHPGPVAVAGGEVHEVRRRQADVDDVDALAEHPVGERGDELGARRTHVPADQHLVGVGVAGEGDTECPGHISVELIRNGAADVVGLDDLVEY